MNPCNQNCKNPRYVGKTTKNINNKMAKTLRVISDFLDMTPGDTFEYNEKTRMYTAERNEEFHRTDDDDSELRSIYSAKFSISEGYAKELIQDGVLEDADDKKAFVNIFDEIDSLTSRYENELKNVDKDMKDFPECMKVERTTVLNNLISVLDYLKGLKK